MSFKRRRLLSLEIHTGSWGRTQTECSRAHSIRPLFVCQHKYWKSISNHRSSAKKSILKITKKSGRSKFLVTKGSYFKMFMLYYVRLIQVSAYEIREHFNGLLTELVFSEQCSVLLANSLDAHLSCALLSNYCSLHAPCSKWLICISSNIRNVDIFSCM